MTVLYAIIALIVAAVIVAKLYLCIAGKEKIVVKTDAPFVVESQTDDAIVISKKLTFVNEGKQCATIMDALVRPQLPYEQYDGIEARGKAEREGEPREDDYFEAVLIQKLGDPNHEDKLNIFAKVKLTPRKGMTLKEIAVAMNKKIGNIGTVRGNIRKKLELDANDDLREALAKRLKR